MEEQIEARVPAEEVWEAWERAHAKQSEVGIEKGEKGKTQFRYKILDVKKGESFSILWKALFVRLIFNHKVQPSPRGSLITYKIQIKGPFAWLVRILVGEKIRRNVAFVLKALVKELEEKRIVKTRRG